MIRTSKLLVKVFGFTLCLSICGVYCLESIPLTLPYDGYYCYLKCLAGCIESTKIERITDRILDDCIPDCEQHENQTQALCVIQYTLNFHFLFSLFLQKTVF